MRNLDMTTLRSFMTVADHGGVTRAATVLNLTQSAVSMQLKRLEELLDVELLDRSNRTIALTAAGEQLLGYARKIIQLNDEVVGRLTDDLYEGELVLGVPHDIVYPVIPRVLKTFNSVFPRVKVVLRSSSTMKLHEALTKGEVDLILTTEGTPKQGGETLAEVPLRWAGTVDGQVWKRRPLKLAFCNVCIFRPIAIRELNEAGIEWELALDADDDRSADVLISADLAIGAILESSIPPHQVAIPNNSGLPDLGVQQINMYHGANPDLAQQQLADLLRQAYLGGAAPTLLRSA
ncbi:HTH-type transcriptional regulator GltC [Roseovarius albus]|uniref:HTH-type transcriptional regulator GltC n=1 Tax=Roseovarius albus TaxID=1247867 RepID=A0A1X6YK94_9RHOB|nr:LysR family transcriptional regulator [Roseovarius albus]SLN23891.1 HTH-type transcriptional regulator GltC [Roseovarius albus]